MTHASDCATHNSPALPAGHCDCGAGRPATFFAADLRDTDGAQLAFVLGALSGIINLQPLRRSSPDDIIASLRSLIAAVNEKRSVVK
jgi:hypothetical protein